MYFDIIVEYLFSIYVVLLFIHLLIYFSILFIHVQH